MKQTMMRIILALVFLAPGVVHAQSSDFPRHDGLVLMGVILQSTPIHPYTRKLDSHHDRYPVADPAAREDIIHNWKILITRYPRTYIRAQILYLEDQGSLTPEMRADFEAALAQHITFRWSDETTARQFINSEESPYLKHAMSLGRDQSIQEDVEYQALSDQKSKVENIAKIFFYTLQLNRLAMEGYRPALDDIKSLILTKPCRGRAPRTGTMGLQITIEKPHRICSIKDPKLKSFWNLHFAGEGLTSPFSDVILPEDEELEIYRSFMLGIHPFADPHMKGK